MKKISFLLFASIFFMLVLHLIIPTYVQAETDSKVYVGGEQLWELESIVSNASGTAKFDSLTNTLTLNGYTGSEIKFEGMKDDIKIDVIGINKIISTANTVDAIYSVSSEKSITLLSSDNTGSLIIENAKSGIYIDESVGDINVNIDLDISCKLHGLKGNNINLNCKNISIKIVGDQSVGYGIRAGSNINISTEKMIIDTDNSGVWGKEITFNSDYTEITGQYYGIRSSDGNILIKKGDLKVTTTEEPAFHGNNSSISVADNLKILNNYDIRNINTFGKGGPVTIWSIGNEPSESALNDSNQFSSEMARTVSIVPQYTVTFNTNGYAVEPVAQKIIKGYKVTEPEALNSDGMIFKGWYKDAKCNTPWNFEEDTVNKDTVLYAKWEKEPVHYTYKFKSDIDLKLTENNIKECTFIVDGDYSLFEKLEIKPLDLVKDIDYTVEEGSTIIKFTDEGLVKLNSLKAGTYNVELSYSDGNIATEELVIEKNTEIINNDQQPENQENQPVVNSVNTPKTGDSIFYIIITIAISIIGLLVTRKRK